MVTLSESQMPQHTHSLMAANAPATANAPSSTTALARSANGFAYNQGGIADATLDTGALPPTGGSQQHNNLQPFLTLNFIIALQGLYPPRS